ncbi:MAG: hypothetical protein ACRD1M_18070 [Terriglobales bacterium]
MPALSTGSPKWLLAAVLTAVGLTLGGARPPAASEITPAEAEILVYISPYAHQVRAAGFDVVPDMQDVSQGESFISFYVVTTAPKPRGGAIETPEFFAVNVHTGTLWDEGSGARVESRELDDVLRVFRRSHGITAATVRRFDALRPEAPR